MTDAILILLAIITPAAFIGLGVEWIYAIRDRRQAEREALARRVREFSR